jgi:hypothetical protein
MRNIVELLNASAFGTAGSGVVTATLIVFDVPATASAYITLAFGVSMIVFAGYALWTTR